MAPAVRRRKRRRPTENQMARDAGRQEGLSQARTDFEPQIAQLRGTVAQAVANFATERATYYQNVEREVVQLSLSIARKILHREAQMDPLLLAGMVRVALDKIEAGTKVVLRVHPRRRRRVASLFCDCANRSARCQPEVAADATLALDHCL